MNSGDVYVIDDDACLCGALAALLDGAGLSTYAYDSPLTFIRDCDDLAMGCIITDVRMPGIDGIDLIRFLKERHLPHPIIVLTGHGDTSTAVEAFKAGAFDFIEKPFSNGTILSAVQGALQFADHHAPSPSAARRNAAFAKLTPREREVLALVVKGHPNKVIARHLDLSQRTVEIYRAGVMRKSGVSSLAELVRLAVSDDPMDERPTTAERAERAQFSPRRWRPEGPTRFDL